MKKILEKEFGLPVINVSRYKIFVEGITESGRICLGNTTFEVDSFLSTGSADED